jgi:cytochrome c peroxidase
MGFAVLAVLGAARSPYMTRQNITREQPIQFSHKHHVGDDGIDCRYCHTSVETSAFVYFNHSIHVNKGVGCSTCHGQVDQMPLVFQANTLLMQWCLDCHRNPEAALRENPEDVYNMNWKAPDNQEEIGQRLAKERNLRTTAELTSCSTCHR